MEGFNYNKNWGVYLKFLIRLAVCISHPDKEVHFLSTYSTSTRHFSRENESSAVACKLLSLEKVVLKHHLTKNFCFLPFVGLVGEQSGNNSN